MITNLLEQQIHTLDALPTNEVIGLIPKDIFTFGPEFNGSHFIQGIDGSVIIQTSFEADWSHNIAEFEMTFTEAPEAVLRFKLAHQITCSLNELTELREKGLNPPTVKIATYEIVNQGYGGNSHAKVPGFYAKETLQFLLDEYKPDFLFEIWEPGSVNYSGYEDALGRSFNASPINYNYLKDNPEILEFFERDAARETWSAKVIKGKYNLREIHDQRSSLEVRDQRIYLLYSIDRENCLPQVDIPAALGIHYPSLLGPFFKNKST